MYGYIYLIVNKINGKTYVGQRKSNKFNDFYMGSGIWLRKAQRKYGIKNFEKFLIQCVYTSEEADKQEIFWIAEYRKRGKAEYNIANGGSGVMNGRKHSLETIEKERQSHLGKKLWPNGRVFTEEWKKRISESKKGSKGFQGHHSDKTKKMLSEQKKGIKFWTNGERNTTSFECPGEGWYLGRVGNYKTNRIGDN